MPERRSYEYSVRIQLCGYILERQFRDRAEAEEYALRIMNETTLIPHMVVKSVYSNIEIITDEGLKLLAKK